MKESSPPGHLGVAAVPERTTRGTRRQQQQQQQQQAAALSAATAPVHINNNNNNNTDPVNKNHGAPPPASAPTTLSAPSVDNDSDSDGDWDVGVGDLVIDLDADLERHHSAPAVSSSASSNAVSSALATTADVAPVLSRGPSGKMSSVEHHAVVDKGLKMKIKRKNVGSKSDIKHEIVKAADANKLSGSGSGAGSVDRSTSNSANSDSTGSNSNSSTTGGSTTGSVGNMPGTVPNSPMDKQKHGAGDQGSTTKEKSAKGRGAHKKEKGRNANNKATEPVSNGTPFHAAPGSTSGGGGGSGGAGGASGGSVGGANNTTTIPPSLAHKFTGNVSVDIYPISTPFNIKKESPAEDPYEFNAKVEDGGRPLSFPVKKIKTEAVSSPMVTSSDPVPTQDVGVETCCAATITDPDCLGPCEPGTGVTLEGIVWQETENGVLVVNVTWRGKTYVGTLMDATKHEWAPPRLNCDSPTSEVDTRTPKGRGKRGRAAANIPDNLDGTRKLRKGRRNNSGTFTAPPSPAKSDASSQGVKRKGKVADLDLSTDGPKASKRCRSSSRGTPTGNGSAPAGSTPGSSAAAAENPALIECPEPNCNKKYKHINGLRYHQTHAHQQSNGAGEEDGEEVKDPPSSEESGPHSPAMSTKSDKATTRSKSKKAAATNAVASNSNHKNLDDGEESVLARSSPRKKEDTSNGAGNGGSSSNNSSNSNVVTAATKNSQQGPEGSKQGKAERKDGEGHSSKKGDNNKPSNVPISTSTALNSNNSSMDDSCKTPTSQMFQISGAPIGCLATSGVMAPPVSVNPIIVSTGVTSTVTTQLIGGTTVTTMPVSLPTGTTLVSLQQPLDAKVDGADKGKKTKGDKTDKLKGKSAVATRPIMPAPATLPVGHGQLSAGNQHGLISQNSPLTAGLKPIQPKPTIMGEPSVNPSLASLAKEKKPKKKKSRDKDQPTGQQHTQQQTQQQLQSQQQQQQQQQSQHMGKGSTHSKDVMFIKQEDAKSVIKTVPSPLKPVGEAGDPRLRDPASLPPELSKQPPVGAPGQQQQHPRSDLSKGETTSPPPNSTKGGGDQQRFARPPSSLSINSPLQVSTESRERSGEVQSPAYSDISDESAPTLENETTTQQQQQQQQQSSVHHKGKEDGDKGGSGGGHMDGGPGKGNDRHQAEEAMAAYNHMYHGYYGQPPYLIPAVPSSTASAAQGCPSRSPPVKSAGDKELDLSGKSSAARKDADGAVKLGGGSGKEGTNSKVNNSEDSANKAAGGGSNNQQPLTEYQLQQQQQQKLLQQHQMYYGGYYGGYPVDPNYMRMVNEAGVYGAQQHGDNKHPDEQLKAKEVGTDLTKEKLMADKIKTERGIAHGQPASLMSPGGRMSDRPSSASSVTSVEGKSLMSPSSSKPPALISEKERKLREMEQRASKDPSLKEKQNENHQILKENIALKSQMAAEGRHHKASPGGGAPGGGSNMPPGAGGGQFENNELKERHLDDLQRFYMYQEQRIMEQQRVAAADEEQRRKFFHDPYGHHAQAQQQQQQQQQHQVVHRGRPVETPPGTPHSGRDHRDSPGGKPSHHGKDEVSRSRDPSIKEVDGGKMHSLDKHKEGGSGGDPEKRPTNASPSPRTTTPKTSKEAGGPPMTSMHGFPAQYLSHAYLQAPHYPQGIAFDPSHPMYRGVNPVIGYGNPAYLHPASMRYHMSPGAMEDGDKAKLLSPSASVVSGAEVRKGGIPVQPAGPGVSGADHPGKALELLQQHASHYNNFGGGQHKIHELQELGKAADSRASPSKGSPDVLNNSSSANRDKLREVSKSPPPQRHLHTHHHTHVVGPPPPGYPLYDPYSGR